MSDEIGRIRKRHRKWGDIWVYCHRQPRWDGKWGRKRSHVSITPIPLKTLRQNTYLFATADARYFLPMTVTTD
jgi:hypothetical protein